MAASDLDRAVKKWSERGNMMRQAGLPDSAWRPLMQKDFTAIMTRGSSPMADRQVNDALRMVAAGSPIKSPSKGLNPLDVIGNIPSDIKDVVTGFPGGITEYVTTLPEQLHDLVNLSKPEIQKKYGLETGNKWSAIWENPAGLLRDVSKAPVAAIIPGIHTAAALTTDTGRKQLEEHPASTAVDVGAAVAALGGAGVFGRAALKSELADRAAAVADVTEFPKPSKLAALQAGKPYKAAGRGMLEVGERIAPVKFARSSIRATLIDIGLHPELAERLGRPWSEIRNRNTREMMREYNGDLIKPWRERPIFERQILNREMKGESALSTAEAEALRGTQLIDDNGNPMPMFDGEGNLNDFARASQNPKSVEYTMPHPQMDEALQPLVQKVIDNEYFTHDGPTPHGVTETIGNLADQPLLAEATKARPSMQTLATRAHRFMEEAARDNPDLVGVNVIDTEKPGGIVLPKVQDVYHKNHPVGRAWATHNERFRKASEEKVRFDQADLRYRAALSDPRTASDPALLATLANRLEKASKEYTTKYNKWVESKVEFNKRYNAYAPASYTPILDKMYRQTAKESIAGLTDEELAARPGVQAHTVEDAMARIEGSTDWNDMAAAIGPDEAERFSTEIQSTWRALAADRGMDPLYLPNTKASRVEHVAFPTIVAKAPEAKAHFSKNTMFNLSRSEYDVVVGLLEHHRQRLTEAGTQEFAQRFVKPYAKNKTEAQTEIQDRIRTGGGITDETKIRDMAAKEMDRHYKTWDPEHHGFRSFFPGEQELVIPKGVERSLDFLGEPPSNNPFFVAYNRTMRVWRFSVLTTPRHMSHVVLGGAMMGVVRDPRFLYNLVREGREARRILHGDEDALLARFGGHPNDVDVEQIMGVAGGKTQGRWVTEQAKRAAQPLQTGVKWVNKIEENATQMYKIVEMLAKERKYRKGGYSQRAARDAAIYEANKMFVDMNAMTPLERTVFRKVFPFYGFTRHLFRYVMTYPADHPLAAAILTNFANQHFADWDSGLPKDLTFLLYMGQPDSEGRVRVVDYRSIDPFRSSYNVFTLGGLASALNPGIQAIMQSMGINTLSGTPELYPNTHYNDATGQIEAELPPDRALGILETFIPTATAIDAHLGLSDHFRNLKVTDPEAYKMRVFSQLGIPYGVAPKTPGTVNVTLRRQTAQMKQWQDAANSVNAAVRTGDFKDAKKYTYVPTPAMLAPFLPKGTEYSDPRELERIYRALQEMMGVKGVSLHATLPKPSR